MIDLARFTCRLLSALAMPMCWSTAWDTAAVAADATSPIVSQNVVFEEVDGTLAIEAEHFYRQTLSDKRAWHLTSSGSTPVVQPDGDPAHVGGAAGGAYVEALPDTRRSDADKLVQGENFSDAPGKLAVLHYRAHFNTAGRYYVWARVFSTGPEDNGLHFGLDGRWPASGQRWQTVLKNGWQWDCKQRTPQQHTGVPLQLFLDVDQPGPHEILVAMREDGAELDRFVLTTRREDGRPEGLGPEVRIKTGALPKPFPVVDAPLVASAGVPTVPAKPAVPLVEPRQPDGNGSVTVSGELKQWHKVTLTLDGPFAHERDNQPNPFTDYRMTVTFRHESGSPIYDVPGYFAADGEAANSSANSGTKWRAHLSPDLPGRWSYSVAFLRSQRIIERDVIDAPGVTPYDGAAGEFVVGATDKTGPDFRAKGRLQYVGGHYLQFAGSGEYFLKAGPDAPETLLGYQDFDDTVAMKRNIPLKTYAPHVSDWRDGDPLWKGDRGKGLIGALNYLASNGCNTISCLPYNAGGDGDNVWPFIARDDKLHYDCSKLDQWQIAFDHATSQGLHLHFKLQEQENDDNRTGHEAKDATVKTSLDGGKLGIERKLFCRELIARFGHELALLWNLGEENTQSTGEQQDMIRYLQETDPYDHNIVVHTFPDWQERVYTPLLGNMSLLTGASLQNGWNVCHERTRQWVRESAMAGRPWVVCNDEQGPAALGVPPDPGYAGHDGYAAEGGKKYNLHDIRKLCLWGTLMAGGAGVEYYFGYQLPQNDLLCEDFRSRDRSWDYCRIALNFFRDQQIPLPDLRNADELVDNPENRNSRFCLAKPGELYLVYLPSGGSTELNLTGAQGDFAVRWFNPREGGRLLTGSVMRVPGGGQAVLGDPPSDPNEDWLIVVRR